MFTGKRLPVRPNPVAISSAISKIPSDRTFCGFVLTIPDGRCASRLALDNRFNDHCGDFMTMRRHRRAKPTISRSSHSPSMRLCGREQTSFLADSLSTGCALSCPIAHRHRAKGIAMITIAEGQKRWRASPLACQYCNAIFIATPPLRNRSPREKRIPAVAASSHQFAAQLNGWRMSDTAKHHSDMASICDFIAALSCG